MEIMQSWDKTCVHMYINIVYLQIPVPNIKRERSETRHICIFNIFYEKKPRAHQSRSKWEICSPWFQWNHPISAPKVNY